MLAIIKKSRKFRLLLLMVFVFSVTTAAGAMEGHERDGKLGHGGSVIAGGESEQPPAGHDGSHEIHCNIDALCINGVWTLMGQSSVVLPATRASIARLLPPDTSMNGLRPRPELRPPRDDS